MAMASGPILAAGGFRAFSAHGYTLLFLPDVNNHALQAAGQPPVYYWLPSQVRLARQDGDDSDYVFSLIRFIGGKPGGDVAKRDAGAVFAFSTTSVPPAAALQAIQEELLAACEGQDDRYWGWRAEHAPEFRPAPVAANTTTVTNLGPLQDPAAPPPSTRALVVPAGGHDPMCMRVEGQWPGAVSPFAENAYSGIADPLASQILWASFHDASSTITVQQSMRLEVMSPEVTLHMVVHVDQVHAYLATDARFHRVFFAADVKAQLEDMRQQGMIECALFVDKTLPSSQALQAAIEERSDLVFQTFLGIALKTMFDPASTDELSRDRGTRRGPALVLRPHVARVCVELHETRQFPYVLDYAISGDLSGIADEIGADRDAEKKYFTQVYLGDLDRYMARPPKPLAGTREPARKRVEQPIAYLSAQFGYPDERGEITWGANMFQ